MTTDELDRIRQRLGTTSYSPWKDDTFALLHEVERLETERDRAREECGYEKRMRAFVSEERDRFIALRARAEADRDRLAAIVERVRELHQPHLVIGPHQKCDGCESRWPCPTITAIEGTDS